MSSSTRVPYPGQFRRLFVALPLPGCARAALSRLQHPDLPGFRWAAPERFHLTLKFIGEVEAELVPDIVAALAPIHVEPFILPCEGVGAFPQQGRPQVVWAGVARGHPRLFQLQYRIENVLFSMGIEPDLRGYHPHVTLARTSEAAPGAVRDWLKQHRGWEGPPLRADAFVLYSSHPSASGSCYREEAVFPLQLIERRRYA